MSRLFSFINEDRISSDNWNAEIDALYAKLVTLTTTMTEYTLGAAVTSAVDDEAYGAGWNGTTDETPSMDNLYDELELRANEASPTFTGTVTLPTGTPSASTEAVHPDYLVDAAQTEIDAFSSVSDPIPNTSATNAVSTSFIKDYHFAPLLFSRDTTSTHPTIGTSVFGVLYTTSGFVMPYDGDILVFVAFANNAVGASISGASNDIHYRIEVREGSTTVRSVMHEYLDVAEGNAHAQWAVLRDLTRDKSYTIRLTAKSVSGTPSIGDPAVLVMGLPWSDSVTRVDTPDIT